MRSHLNEARFALFPQMSLAHPAQLPSPRRAVRAPAIWPLWIHALYLGSWAPAALVKGLSVPSL